MTSIQSGVKEYYGPAVGIGVGDGGVVVGVRIGVEVGMDVGAGRVGTDVGGTGVAVAGASVGEGIGVAVGGIGVGVGDGDSVDEGVSDAVGVAGPTVMVPVGETVAVTVTDGWTVGEGTGV